MHRFKLETLLRHRRHLEEICQKELAESERLLADEKDKLRRQKREKQINLRNLQDNQRETIDVSVLILSTNYIRQLSEKIEEQKRCVREASKKLN